MYYGFGKASCHVNENPNGTFSFVGGVPMALAYQRHDGAPIDPGLARGIQKCGPGLFRKTVSRRTWPSEDEARAEASRLGIAVAAD